MAAPDQKRRLLTKLVMALRDELGRVPTPAEVEQVFLRPWGRHQAVLGLPHWRQEQQHTGQLAIF